MCKAPKPPEQKEPKKLQFLRNPILDAALGGAATVSQLRTGRSALRIVPGSNVGTRAPGEALPQPGQLPTGSPPAISGRQPSQRVTDPRQFLRVAALT